MNLNELYAWVRSYVDQGEHTLPDTALKVMVESVEGYLNKELYEHPALFTRISWPVRAGLQNIPLPENLLDLRNVKLGKRKIEQYSIDHEDGADENGGFIHMGDCIRIYPIPAEDTTFTLDVALALPSLTGSIGKNFVSQYHADIYQYGLLAEVAGYLRDPQNQSVWFQEFGKRVAMLKSQGWNSYIGGAPLVHVT